MKTSGAYCLALVAESCLGKNLLTLPVLLDALAGSGILFHCNKYLLDCRYHYNLADTRLRQHIDKGNEDGLYISCVASAANLWALIMDAGTGFSSQVYELSAVFLHKVVI